MDQMNQSRFQLFEETEKSIDLELNYIKENANQVVQQLSMFLEQSKQSQQEMDDIYFACLQELEEGFLFFMSQFKQNYSEQKEVFQKQYDQKKLNLINEMNKTQRYISEISQIEQLDGSKSFMLVQKSLKNLNKISEEIRLVYNETHFQSFQLDTINVDALFMKILQNLLFNSIYQRPKSKVYADQIVRQRSLSSSSLFQSTPLFQVKSGEIKADEIVEEQSSDLKERKRCSSSPLENQPEKEEQSKVVNEVKDLVNETKEKQSSLLKLSKQKNSYNNFIEKAKQFQVEQKSELKNSQKFPKKKIPKVQQTKNNNITQSVPISKVQKVANQDLQNKTPEKKNQIIIQQVTLSTRNKSSSSPINTKQSHTKIPNSSYTHRAQNKFSNQQNTKRSSTSTINNLRAIQSSQIPKQNSQKELSTKQFQNLNTEIQTMVTEESTQRQVQTIKTDTNIEPCLMNINSMTAICSSSEALKMHIMSSKRIKMAITNPDNLSLSKDFSTENFDHQYKGQESSRKRVISCGNLSQFQNYVQNTNNYSYQQQNSFNSNQQNKKNVEDQPSSHSNSPATNPLNKLNKKAFQHTKDNSLQGLRQNIKTKLLEQSPVNDQSSTNKVDKQNNDNLEDLFHPSPYYDCLNSIQQQSLEQNLPLHNDKHDQCEFQSSPQLIQKAQLNTLSHLKKNQIVDIVSTDVKSQLTSSITDSNQFKKNIQESVKKALIPKQQIQIVKNLEQNSLLQSPFSNNLLTSYDLAQKQTLEDIQNVFNNPSPISQSASNDQPFFSNQNFESNKTSNEMYKTELQSKNPTTKNQSSMIQVSQSFKQNIPTNCIKGSLTQGQANTNSYRAMHLANRNFLKNNQVNSTQNIINNNQITRQINQINNNIRLSQNDKSMLSLHNNSFTNTNSGVVLEQQADKVNDKSVNTINNDRYLDFNFQNSQISQGNNYHQKQDQLITPSSVKQTLSDEIVSNEEFLPQCSEQQLIIQTPVKKKINFEKHSSLNQDSQSPVSNQLTYSQKQLSSPSKNLSDDSVKNKSNEISNFLNSSKIKHNQQPQNTQSTFLDFIPGPTQIDLEFENSINYGGQNNQYFPNSQGNVENIISSNTNNSHDISTKCHQQQNINRQIPNLNSKHNLSNNYCNISHKQVSARTINEEQDDDYNSDKNSYRENQQQIQQSTPYQNLKSSYTQINSDNMNSNNNTINTNSNISKSQTSFTPNNNKNLLDQSNLNNQAKSYLSYLQQIQNNHPLPQQQPQVLLNELIQQQQSSVISNSNQIFSSGNLSSRQLKDNISVNQSKEKLIINNYNLLPPTSGYKVQQKTTNELNQQIPKQYKNEKILQNKFNLNDKDRFYALEENKSVSLIQKSSNQQSIHINPHLQQRTRAQSECSDRIDYRLNYQPAQQFENESIKKATHLSRANSNGQLLTQDKKIERALLQRKNSIPGENSFSCLNLQCFQGIDDSSQVSSNNQSANFGGFKQSKELADQKQKCSEVFNDIQFKITSSSLPQSSNIISEVGQQYRNKCQQNYIPKIGMTNQFQTLQQPNENNSYSQSSSVPSVFTTMQNRQLKNQDSPSQSIENISQWQQQQQQQQQFFFKKNDQALTGKTTSHQYNETGLQVKGFTSQQMLIMQSQSGEQVRNKVNSLNAKNMTNTPSPSLLSQQSNFVQNSQQLSNSSSSQQNSNNSFKNMNGNVSGITSINGIILQFGGSNCESLGEIHNSIGEKLGSIHYYLPQHLKMKDPGYFGFSCVMLQQSKSILFLGGYYAEKSEEKTNFQESSQITFKSQQKQQSKKIFSKDILEYKIETNQFSVLNCQLHRNIQDATAVYLEKQNEIVIIGGKDENNITLKDCVTINLIDHKIIEKQSLPHPITGFCCTYESLKDTLYVLGGMHQNKPLNSVYRLNLQSCNNYEQKQLNEWDHMPKMINCRVGAQCKILKRNLYIFGGYDGRLYLNSVEMYNFDLNKWFIVSFMKIPRAFYGMVCDQERIIILGGNASSQIIANNIEIFDITKDQWQTINNSQIQKTHQVAFLLNQESQSNQFGQQNHS